MEPKLSDLAERLPAVVKEAVIVLKKCNRVRNEDLLALMFRLCCRVCDFEDTLTSFPRLDQRVCLLQTEFVRALKVLLCVVAENLNSRTDQPRNRSSLSSLCADLDLVVSRFGRSNDPKLRFTRSDYRRRFGLLEGRKCSVLIRTNLSRLTTFLEGLVEDVIILLDSKGSLPAAFYHKVISNTDNSLARKYFEKLADLVDDLWMCSDKPFRIRFTQPPPELRYDPEPFANGTFGSIHKAHIRVDGRDKVGAVKLIKREYMDDEEEVPLIREMFLREAKMLSQSHGCPFIVHLIESFSTDDDMILVTAYLPFGSIKDIVKKREMGLSGSHLRYVALAIATALSYLHKRQIYHGDLKGENVLVSDTGIIKLCDFGNAHFVGEKRSESSSPGTAHFMAPEIVNAYLEDDDLEEPRFGLAIDVWALGITIIELVNRDPPCYPGELTVLWDVFHFRESFTEYIQGLVEEDTRRFVRLCLVKDAKDRASIEQLLKSSYFSMPLCSPLDFTEELLL